MKNESLWNRIAQFQLDDPEAGFSFSKRLALENDWTLEFTRRVILEYRRFLYLCCEAGHPVTPSDEVDQAWHLHLCYTRSYWEDLCDQTLGKKIHHGPTKGGSTEQEKFADWYSRTKETYQEEFGEVAPADLWPDHSIRFAKRTVQRVDTTKNFILSKRSTLLAATTLGIATVLTGCSDDGSTGIFIFIAIFIGIAIVINSAGGGGKGGGGKGGAAGGGGSCGSGCSSGCGGCGGD